MAQSVAETKFSGVAARDLQRFVRAAGAGFDALAADSNSAGGGAVGDAKAFGLLHLLSLPSFVAPLVGFLLLDYFYYWWHVATHRAPFLWRFHSVHHTDLEMDVSTAARFHWGEILISVLLRVALVTLIGASPLTFLIYEIVFECATQFHHSNWRLHETVERGVNRILVTPRMHGTHHSVRREWLDSNWGTVFSWWDKLHGTHRTDAPDDLKIGLPHHRDPRELTILELWKMPFRKPRDAS